MHDNSLTVAICTYNRAESLRVLLNSLVLALDADSDSKRSLCNVLVVNNNCTDHTESVVEEYKPRLPLTSVLEARQGLSNARNRALRLFSGDAILFLDDDVSIEAGTLSSYLRALRDCPQFDYFGGPIEVDWQGTKPSWFRSEDLVLLNGLLVRYLPAKSDLSYDEIPLGPFGANFLLRRRLLNQVDNFDVSLGVCADPRWEGERKLTFFSGRKTKVPKACFSVGRESNTVITPNDCAYRTSIAMASPRARRQALAHPKAPGGWLRDSFFGAAGNCCEDGSDTFTNVSSTSGSCVVRQRWHALTGDPATHRKYTRSGNGRS